MKIFIKLFSACGVVFLIQTFYLIAFEYLDSWGYWIFGSIANLIVYILFINNYEKD